MNRPNEAQVQAAVAIMKHHFQRYGLTASDTMTRSTVFSIHSVMGGPGEPSMEFASVIEEAGKGDLPRPKPVLSENEDGSLTVVDENALGLPVGATYMPYQPPEEPKHIPTEEILNSMTKQEIIDGYGNKVKGLHMDRTKADLIEAVMQYINSMKDE